jgi:hypothetical protein
MKTHWLVEWKGMLLLGLAPLLIMGILLAIGLLIGYVQYDPAYFTQDYVQRFQTPVSLLEELEQVIKYGDLSKVLELQGVRWPSHNITAIPNFQFSMFWHKDRKYQDYLYFNTSNYRRYIVHIKQVNGRYVWSPETLYYYVDSGRWVRTFFPILAIWWLALLLYIITTWIYRTLTGYKPEVISQGNEKKV